MTTQCINYLPPSINAQHLHDLLEAYRFETRTEHDDEISEKTKELTASILQTTPPELLKAAGHWCDDGLDFYVSEGEHSCGQVIYCQGGTAGIELVAEIIKRMLPVGETWTMTWVYNDDFCRPDSYGADGVRISASDIYWLNLDAATIGHGFYHGKDQCFSATVLPNSIEASALISCLNAIEHELAPGPADPEIDTSEILKIHIGKALEELAEGPYEPGFSWRVIDEQGVKNLVAKGAALNPSLLNALLAHLLPIGETLEVNIILVSCMTEVPKIKTVTLKPVGIKALIEA
jgi:hypothetical protein